MELLLKPSSKNQSVCGTAVNLQGHDRPLKLVEQIVNPDNAVNGGHKASPVMMQEDH